jgi:hypothetical protein
MPNYGADGFCLRCNTKGDRHHVISPTPEVERMAERLADRLAPLCKTKGRMLGVMLADGEWVVSLSSIASLEEEFVNAVLELGPMMSPIAHDWSTVPVRTLGGHDIRDLLKTPAGGTTWQAIFKVHEPAPNPREPKPRHTLPLAGGPGCVCAAPKLVSYLTQDAGAASLPPKQIAMLELWCGKSEGSWTHKLPAPSCSKCQRILPTLMCRSPH